MFVITFIAGFKNRKRQDCEQRARKIEAVCCLFVIVAVAGWLVTSRPMVALTLSMLGNFFAAVPTIAKTWKAPRTESFSGWAVLVLAAICALASLETVSAATIIVPAYILIESLVIALLALRSLS
jgi:fructose-specific phosphotransferase system IIC component